MKNKKRKPHHAAADRRKRLRWALAVLAKIAGAVFAVLVCASWGLLLLRLIRYGHGFDHGTYPPLAKWTPLQLFAAFCTETLLGLVVGALWAAKWLRQNRAVRSGLSGARTLLSPREDVSGKSKGAS